MNTSRKGGETESVVLSRLMTVGLSVSVPFGDSDRYDLVADDGDSLYRVQCRTGSWINGTVRFNLYTSTVGTDGRTDLEYTAKEIDVYAVYSRKTDEVYWVPIRDTGSGEMRLRVDRPHPNAALSKINWASDYRLASAFE